MHVVDLLIASLSVTLKYISGFLFVSLLVSNSALNVYFTQYNHVTTTFPIA